MVDGDVGQSAAEHFSSFRKSEFRLGMSAEERRLEVKSQMFREIETLLNAVDGEDELPEIIADLHFVPFARLQRQARGKT